MDTTPDVYECPEFETVVDVVEGELCPPEVPNNTTKTFVITTVPDGYEGRLFGPNPSEYGEDVECLDDDGMAMSCDVDSIGGEVTFVQTGEATLTAVFYRIPYFR